MTRHGLSRRGPRMSYFRVAADEVASVGEALDRERGTAGIEDVAINAADLTGGRSCGSKTAWSAPGGPYVAFRGAPMRTAGCGPIVSGGRSMPLPDPGAGAMPLSHEYLRQFAVPSLAGQRRLQGRLHDASLYILLPKL